MALKGRIFNIQHFSIHDGPGIRTVVFLKGCPLRCLWCANPESQKAEPELAWTAGECIACQNCVRTLPKGQVYFEEERLLIDRSVPIDEKKVRLACPTEALHVIGREIAVANALAEVEKDQPFYRTSGGGLTISGGEPLMQPEFTYALLKEAGERKIHRAIETSCFAPWTVCAKIAPELDILLTDVKCMDEDRHRKFTGKSNQPILDNIRRIRQLCPELPILIRTPVIPGFNDTEEDLDEIIAFVKTVGASYETLRYHKLGQPKYETLHRVYPMGNVDLAEERYQRLESFAVREMALR